MDRRNQLFLPYVDQVVGKVLILEPIKDRNSSYECAAWWEETVSDTGVFDVKLNLNYLYPDNHPIVYASIPSTVTDDYFPAMYGGVSVSRTPYKPKHLGERRKLGLSMPLYDAILQSGNSPAHRRWVIPHGELWSLCEQDMRARVVRYAEAFPAAYAKWLAEGDGSYVGNLSMVGAYGGWIAEWEDRLTKLLRHMEFKTWDSYPQNFDLDAFWDKHKELAPA
jgi:hypothetical protein